MSVVDTAPIVDWLLRLLESGTGRPVGDSEAPTKQDGFPYVVVREIDGSSMSGPFLVAPDADLALVFQVDSVGRTIDQARWMADTVRRTILARTATGSFQVQLVNPTGYSVVDRQPSGGPPTPVSEGPAPNRVYSFPERFTIHVTPGG